MKRKGLTFSPPASAGRQGQLLHSRWIWTVVLLLGVFTSVQAQTKDVITFTGGHADVNNPDIYVIDVGDFPATTCNPETYEWSNVDEVFTVTLRRTNAAHAASITLKDPIMQGEFPVEFEAGETEKTVKLNQTIEYVEGNPGAWSGYVPTIYTVSYTSCAESQYQVLILKTNRTGADAPRACTFETHLECLQNLQGFDRASADLRRFGEYILIRFKMSTEVKVTENSRLVMDVRYTDHEGLSPDADDYGMSKTREVSLTPINAGSVCDELWYLYKPLEDEYLHSYKDIRNNKIDDDKCIVYAIREVGPIEVANPAEGAVQYMFFSRNDLPELNSNYLVYGGRSSFAPHFSNASINKTSVNSGEALTITATMDNWQFVKRAQREFFMKSFGVTFDGGETSVPCRATFDETTGRLTCNFNAPTEAGTVDVALCSKLEDFYIGPNPIIDPGCFFTVNVASTQADAVPAQSLTFESLPVEGSIVALDSYTYWGFIGWGDEADEDGYGWKTDVDMTKVPLTVSCSPANATDANNVTYSITNADGASAHFDFATSTNDVMYLGTTSGKVTVTATTEGGLSATRSFYVWATAPRGKEHTSTYLAETTFPLFQFELENALAVDAPVTVNYTHLNGTQWTETYQLKDLKKHVLNKGRVLYDLPFSFTEEHPNVSDDGSEVGQAIVTAQVLMQVQDVNGNSITVESIAKLVPDLRMPSFDDFKEYYAYYSNLQPQPFTAEVMYLPKKGFTVGFEIPQLNLRKTYSNLSGDPVPDWLTLEDNGLYYTAHINVQPELDHSNPMYDFYTMAQRSYNPGETWRYEMTSMAHLMYVNADFMHYRVNGEDVTGDLTFDNTEALQNLVNKFKEDGFVDNIWEALEPTKAEFYVNDDFLNGADVTLSCEGEVLQKLTNYKGYFVFIPPADGHTYNVEVNFTGYGKRYNNTFVSHPLTNIYKVWLFDAGNYYSWMAPSLHFNYTNNGKTYDHPFEKMYVMYDSRFNKYIYTENPVAYLTSDDNRVRVKNAEWFQPASFYIKPELMTNYSRRYGSSSAIDLDWYYKHTLDISTPYSHTFKWTDLAGNSTVVSLVDAEGQLFADATINYVCVDKDMTNQGCAGTAEYDDGLKGYQISTDPQQFAQLIEVVPTPGSGYEPMLSTMYLWNYDYTSRENQGKVRRHTIVMRQDGNHLNCLTLETPKSDGRAKGNNMDALINADDLLMVGESETVNYSQTADQKDMTKHIYDSKFGSEGWHGTKYAHLTGVLPYTGTLDANQLKLEGLEQQPTLTTTHITTADFPLSQDYCLFDFDLTDRIAENSSAKPVLKNGETTLANLPTLHNHAIDQLAMEEANNITLSPTIPDLKKVDNDATANGVDMKDTSKAFDKFNFQLPPVLPFTVNIERDGDFFIIRACMEKNFLPGGEIMDAMDKLGNYQYFDEQFQACMDAVNSGQEVDDDFFDDIPRWPSAFCGIKGYLSGIGYFDRENNKFEFTFYNGGITFEASAAASANLTFGIVGGFGMSIDAKMAMTLGLVNTAAEMGNVSSASTTIDFVFDYQARLKVCAWAYAGIDLWIAKAVCGVRGGACIDLHHRAYVSKGQAGMKTTLQAKMEAFAEARFLFWKKKKTWPIFNVKKEYLVPNKPSNPFHPANPEPLFTMTRQNVTKSYKKLKRKVIADLGTPIISNVNGMARPDYLLGGESLLFNNLNKPKDYNDDRLQLYSNGHEDDLVETGIDSPMYDFAEAHNNDGLEVVAFEQVSEAIDGTELDAMSEDDQTKTVTEMSEIHVAMRNNGGSWTDATVGFSWGDYGCITPAVAVQSDGKAAVVWQQGVAKFNEQGSRYIDGSLMLARYDGSYWNEPIEIKRIHSRSVPADYQVSMKQDSVLVMMTLQQDVENEEKQSSVVYVSISPDDKVRERYTQVEGVKPQMVHVNGANLVGYIKTNESGRDIELNTVNMKGEPTGKLSGSLGMDKRTVNDFKLVAEDDAIDLEDVALLWTQSDQESTDNGDGTTTVSMKNRLYASKLCSHDKLLYFSTPVEVATMPDDVSLASMDGYLDDRTMKVAYCVTNEEDGGAVLENTFEFDNAIDHKARVNTYQMTSEKTVPVTITVANNGFEPINSIDVTMNGKTTTHEVMVMPQEKTELSASYPVGDDFNGTIDYDVTANFIAGNSNALKIRRRGANYKAPQRVIRQSGTQMNVRQVDMALKVLSKKADADGKTTIVAEVNNASLLPLADDVTVKVGLYNSPVVDQNSVAVTEVTVKAADLYDATEKQNKVKIVTLTADKPDVDQVLYLCTTPMQGSEVLTDVRPSNNVLPVRLAGKLLLGDINGDGKVDVSDYIGVANRILGQTPAGFIERAGDVDGNGVIDVSDYIGIANIILFGSPYGNSGK